MKKLIALLLALAMCLSLVACGGGSEKADAPAANAPAADAPAANAPAADAKTILHFAANIGDFGLNDMIDRAARAAVEKYGFKHTLVEYGADTSQAVNSLVDALDTKHYDYVVAMGWYITDEIVARSKDGGEWSDIKFILMHHSRLLIKPLKIILDIWS